MGTVGRAILGSIVGVFALIGLITTASIVYWHVNYSESQRQLEGILKNNVPEVFSGNLPMNRSKGDPADNELSIVTIAISDSVVNGQTVTVVDANVTNEHQQPLADKVITASVFDKKVNDNRYCQRKITSQGLDVLFPGESTSVQFIFHAAKADIGEITYRVK